jgi:hypothetical protein
MLLPYEWWTPQQDFFVDGFVGELHVFSFTVTTIAASGPHKPEWLAAKCPKCAAVIRPDRTSMREHARLHIAVDLARRAETVTA